jgi:hypothetical protein
MEQWEIDLRDKLDKELENKMYEIREGEFVVFTGKQGKIEFEVSLERVFREMMGGDNG